ncbi:ABC transporter ATP-binding protein [Dyadobacter psychrophilus]|uniref:Iron complex transport system ATP-binding protein n=1 Tax=Dyadobacter psychrophilus TaxID=651661 RepID=A0A1T5HB89_9BACT|nr:ABC transporter ATP-binding protein [Dyadobacter psychrophilus]SKC17963.1 iron complex transport system ATP-binding protein [Dyadobacter psychrophilus]
MSDVKPFLETKELAIGYKTRSTERVISENLNLTLEPGQLVCLLGSNGSGKSTLMRTIAGLQPALAGVVYIGQQPLATLKSAELAQKLSLVLTERIEAGNLTALEVITLGRTPYTGWLGALSSADQKKIDEAISLTHVEDLINRKIHQLSDGERQKVMLTRALAQDTELILLDEPTAHLDLPNRVEMMRLLHTLARQTGKAILLSTHELDLALQAADMLWLMQPDGLIVTGVPEDLVLNGAFESAFAKSGFFFDKSSGTFNIYQDVCTHSICISGDPMLAFWTKRALQREGFGVTDHDHATYRVHCDRQDEAAIWQMESALHASKYFNIADLVSGLKSAVK